MNRLPRRPFPVTPRGLRRSMLRDQGAIGAREIRHRRRRADRSGILDAFERWFAVRKQAEK